MANKDTIKDEKAKVTISICLSPSQLSRVDGFVDKNKDLYRSTLIQEAIELWLTFKEKQSA